MFNTHPALICNKHTGSEWAELSQEAGLINYHGWNSTKGHAQKFQINVDHIPQRRKQLKAERKSRDLKAENYTEINQERLKQSDRVHGHTIDSLTMEIMHNKAGRKNTLEDVDTVENCTCLNQEKTRERLQKTWDNL